MIAVCVGAFATEQKKPDPTDDGKRLGLSLHLPRALRAWASLIRGCKLIRIFRVKQRRVVQYSSMLCKREALVLSNKVDTVLTVLLDHSAP